MSSDDASGPNLSGLRPSQQAASLLQHIEVAAFEQDLHCALARPQGSWLWPVKDWIDRKWMTMYGAGLAAMAVPGAQPDPAQVAQKVAAAGGPAALAALSTSSMRCTGCASKVDRQSDSQ